MNHSLSKWCIQFLCLTRKKRIYFFSQLGTHLDVDVVFCYVIMIQYLNDTHFNFLSHLLLFIPLFMSISFDIYIVTILM